MTTFPPSDDRDPRHVEHFDPTEFHAVANTVIEAIAEVEDTAPLELDPVHETVNLEALERFVEHANYSPHEPSVVVGFTVDAWDVFVHGDGRVAVYESVDDVADAVDGSTDPRESAGCD